MTRFLLNDNQRAAMKPHYLGQAGQTARINWIDYAKGICIIMVVMMHSTLGVGEALGQEGLLHWVVAWARPFRMPDFFLIAGLFLSRSINQNWRYFADRKILYFLYFYVIWMLIQLLSKQGYLIFNEPSAFIHELGLAFLEPYTTLWFIYILPMMFVLVKLLKDQPKWLILILAMAAETSRRITGWHTDWIIIDEFPVRFVYFYAGFMFAPLVFKYVSWVQKNTSLSLIYLTIWAALNAAAVFTPASLLPANILPAFLTPTHMLSAHPAEFGSLAFYPALSLVFGVFGVSAVLLCAGLLAKYDGLKMVRYAGQNSLVVYLSFFLPMALTRYGLIKLGFTNITFISCSVTIMAIAIPLLFHRAIQHSELRFLYTRPKSLTLT
jgi:uncharacterized membrane protein YcfT